MLALVLLVAAGCSSKAEPPYYTGNLNPAYLADAWIDAQDAKFDRVTPLAARNCLRDYYERFNRAQLQLLAQVRIRNDIPDPLMDAWLDGVNACGV